MRTLFRIEGVAATVNLGHIRRHYYQSHRILNPSDIVPVGPSLRSCREPQRNRRLSARL
jgi:putative glutathione S-transferase